MPRLPKTFLATSAALVTLLLLATAWTTTMTAAPEGAIPAADTASDHTASGTVDRPIVVELFTSQGCSSCPPADTLLHRLGNARPDVLPLSFHVDYWDRLGWRDPYSSRRWSKRQERYNRALRTGRVYTPQIVIDGQAETNGSDGKAIARFLREARQRPPAGKIGLMVESAEGALQVAVVVEASGELADSLELMVALYERGLSTPVKRGENGGRTLENDFVVRRLENVAELVPAQASADGSASFRAALSLPVDMEWQRENLGVVAFLQNPRDLTIHGAARWRARAADGG